MSLSIGEPYVGIHSGLKAGIAEILVFNRELTGSERATIESYLNTKQLVDGTAGYQQNDTQVLNEFTVSSNRTLSLIHADGNSQSLDYTAGSSETLNFSDLVFKLTQIVPTIQAVGWMVQMQRLPPAVIYDRC